MIELFSDEPLGTAPSFNKAFAGDTVNVLFMASRLGSSCGYITRLGDDPFADYLLDAWGRQGIDSTRAPRVPGSTAVHFISLLPGGDREFVYYRKGGAASTMVPHDLDDDYIGGAKVLHLSALVQGISNSVRQTVLRAAQIAHERGVTVSFDTNLRLNMWTVEEAREGLEEVLPYVDIVFPSFPDETKALIGADTEDGAIDYFMSRGVGIVGLKCGEAGAWVASEEGVASVPGVAPRGVSDTTGAGDAFVGGFLHSILSGKHPFDCARWGVACAGLKVAGRGGIASQPSRAEVEELLESVQASPR